MALCVPGGCDTSSCHRSVTAVSPRWHLRTAQGSGHGGPQHPWVGTGCCQPVPGGAGASRSFCQEPPRPHPEASTAMAALIPRLSREGSTAPLAAAGQGDFPSGSGAWECKAAARQVSGEGRAWPIPNSGRCCPAKPALESRPSLRLRFASPGTGATTGSRFVELEKGRTPTPSSPRARGAAPRSGGSPGLPHRCRGRFESRWEEFPAAALRVGPGSSCLT